jgi:hypothetical protein
MTEVMIRCGPQKVDTYRQPRPHRERRDHFHPKAKGGIRFYHTSYALTLGLDATIIILVCLKHSFVTEVRTGIGPTCGCSRSTPTFAITKTSIPDSIASPPFVNPMKCFMFGELVTKPVVQNRLSGPTFTLRPRTVLCAVDCTD